MKQTKKIRIALAASLVLSLAACAKEGAPKEVESPPPVSGEPPVMKTDQKPGDSINKVFLRELLRGIFGG